MHHAGYMWIDYKKAYNSVPHLWISKTIELYNIYDMTCTFMKNLIPFWRSRIYLPYNKECVTTQEIMLKRGILQGDEICPFT